MDKQRKKKKITAAQVFTIALYMTLGMVCGIMATRQEKNGLLHLGYLLISIYVAMFFQVIVHEAGHLVFGLLSGYRFGSFRIFSFMWVKTEGKLRLKRHSIAGTGGQCLLFPPDLVDGTMPVMLYNLGGALMNVVVSSLFLVLYWIWRDVAFLSDLLLLTALAGYVIALTNGVPMRMGNVDNDGYNAFSLSKNKDAAYAFWVQLKMNELMACGVRLKDMPAEWFTVPTEEAMQNSLVAATGVFACNRLMDEGKWEEADALMEKLLSPDGATEGLYRNLLICDRMYCELMGEKREGKLAEMYTKEQKSFMKSMEKCPSVLRTEYAYAMLWEKDTAKAQVIKARFEKIAKNYPYEADIASERELMDHIEKTVGL